MRRAVLFLAASAVAVTSGIGSAQPGVRNLDQREVAEAQRQHAQVIKELGGAETGARAAYVEGVGRRVAAAEAERLTSLLAQARKFAPKIVYFDKDRGAEIFIRAIGGRYDVLRPGEPTGLNPLQLPDTAGNRAFLVEWLGRVRGTNLGK